MDDECDSSVAVLCQIGREAVWKFNVIETLLIVHTRQTKAMLRFMFEIGFPLSYMLLGENDVCSKRMDFLTKFLK